MKFLDIGTYKTHKEKVNGNCYPSTDERVAPWYSKLDKNKFDVLENKGNFPIVIEYELLEDGTRATKYKDAVNGFKAIDREAIAQDERLDFEEKFRKERNELLNQADKSINELEDKGQDATELRAYRQKLRDATETWEMPAL